MKFASFFLAIAMLGVGPTYSATQLPPASPAPATADLRTYDWKTAFPISPPFSEWRQVGSIGARDGNPTGYSYLHSKSLNWESATTLNADILIYFDGSTTAKGGYYRAQISILCDFHFAIQINAGADVVVDPTGQIKPVSAVKESFGAKYPIPNSVFEELCSDASFREPYMATP